MISQPCRPSSGGHTEKAEGACPRCLSCDLDREQNSIHPTPGTPNVGRGTGWMTLAALCIVRAIELVGSFALPGSHGPFTRRLVSAGKSSYSAGTANCEKSPFCARNSDRRERTTRPFVVNCRRELRRDERDRAARTALGDPEVARSPLRAHPGSALWCTRAVAPSTPFFPPHLRAAR
jgi:hypothetical protein